MPALPPAARYMAVGALCLAGMAVFVKLLAGRLPVVEIVLVRGIIALILSYAVIKRAQLSPWGINKPVLLLRGSFGCCGLLCMFYAITALPLAVATVIQFIYPAFTAILAYAILGERSPRGIWVVIAVSFAGVLLVAQPGILFGGVERYDTFALAVALGGALFSSCAYVSVRKLSQSDNPSVIVFYFPLVTVPVIAPFVAPVAVWPVGREWIYLLCLGLLTQIGQICLTRALRHGKAASTSIYSYLQVIFAVIFGIVIFQEIPDAWTLAGAALILGGAWINAVRS